MAGYHFEVTLFKVDDEGKTTVFDNGKSYYGTFRIDELETALSNYAWTNLAGSALAQKFADLLKEAGEINDP